MNSLQIISSKATGRQTKLDPLTETGNSAALDTCLDIEINLAKRLELPLSVLSIEIDYFKRIVETYGNTSGNIIIKNSADIIKSCLRETDLLFHSDMDQFFIIAPNTDLSATITLAKEIHKKIREHKPTSDTKAYKITSSLGLAALAKNEDKKSLKTNAQLYLAKAKDNGRNCICF